MSTLATAHLASDSEDDLDFVPSTSKPRLTSSARDKRRRSSSSGSSSSGAGEGVDEEEAKRLKLDQQAVDEEERQRRATEAFRAMVEESAGLKPSGVAREKEVGTVEIKRARTFAGETIYEMVSLPANDPEAIAVLAKGKDPPTNDEPLKPDTTRSINLERDQPSTHLLGAAFTAARAVTAPTSGPPTPPSASSPISMPAKPPIRRKPRQSLEQMSAALSKGRKMTTLEKSQLDWKSHTSAEPSVHAELEANRRTGGYLEKRDFLDRVGDRRMETFDTRKKEKEKGKR